ncbi:MAG: agarase [Verrucomicrobia bacterium]|nr:agarase [Verrucomicrobiota bacterium]
MKLNRRKFLASAGALLAGAWAGGGDARAGAGAGKGFFSLAQRNGRWWLVTPAGEPFFSIGLNHIDPSPLRFTENGDLWQRKYGNSMERWLKEAVAPDLRAWGFNSVGWTQEVVTRGLTNHRHSRAFTFEEYQWLGLPYCHQLPFADFHQWEAETRHPDLKSAEFAEWCDYVARENCVRMKDDPKLIGYFYVDCPTWIHTTNFSTWKGPLFDPEKLKTGAGREELFDLATSWYRITHDAIRRYDPHHLILGDRYEANAPLPEEVVRAALPFVDVLSFQHFGLPDKVQADLARWHKLVGKPVLYADGHRARKLADGVHHHDAKGYVAILAALREVRGCVGMHLCGAYLRNRCRQRGLRDEHEQPDAEPLAGITAANREMAEWVKQTTKTK